MTVSTLKLFVQGYVTYVKRPDEGEALCTTVHDTGHDGHTSSNLQHDERRVHLYDIRKADRVFSLKENGFTLQKLRVPAEIDWQDAEQVKTMYYPVAEKLLKAVTGASRVHIFDHTLRIGQLRAPESKTQSARRGRPQGSLHVDYDHHSGIDRLSELLPDEADKLRETPFAVIQVWRPLKGPVRSSPLCMIDVKTVQKQDMTPFEFRRPERLGKNFAVHYNKDHRFYFAEGIRTDEAYVFVCYHSQLDRAQFTPHAGFRYADGEPEEERESVELRSYCFWEQEPKQEVQRVYNGA